MQLYGVLGHCCLYILYICCVDDDIVTQIRRVETITALMVTMNSRSVRKSTPPWLMVHVYCNLMGQFTHTKKHFLAVLFRRFLRNLHPITFAVERFVVVLALKYYIYGLHFSSDGHIFGEQ